MKVKLYHKFLKACCKVFPEEKFTPKKLFEQFEEFVVLCKIEAFCINSKNIRKVVWKHFGGKELFEKRYAKFSRKYNTSYSKLKRAVNDGRI